MNRYYLIREIHSDCIYGYDFDCLEDAEFMLKEEAYKYGQDESEYEIIEVLKKAKKA